MNAAVSEMLRSSELQPVALRARISSPRFVCSAAFPAVVPRKGTSAVGRDPDTVSVPAIQHPKGLYNDLCFPSFSSCRTVSQP